MRNAATFLMLFIAFTPLLGAHSGMYTSEERLPDLCAVQGRLFSFLIKPEYFSHGLLPNDTLEVFKLGSRRAPRWVEVSKWQLLGVPLEGDAGSHSLRLQLSLSRIFRVLTVDIRPRVCPGAPPAPCGPFSTRLEALFLFPSLPPPRDLSPSARVSLLQLVSPLSPSLPHLSSLERVLSGEHQVLSKLPENGTLSPSAPLVSLTLSCLVWEPVSLVPPPGAVILQSLFSPQLPWVRRRRQNGPLSQPIPVPFEIQFLETETVQPPAPSTFLSSSLATSSLPLSSTFLSSSLATSSIPFSSTFLSSSLATSSIPFSSTFLSSSIATIFPSLSSTFLSTSLVTSSLPISSTFISSSLTSSLGLSATFLSPTLATSSLPIASTFLSSLSFNTSVVTIGFSSGLTVIPSVMYLSRVLSSLSAHLSSISADISSQSADLSSMGVEFSSSLMPLLTRSLISPSAVPSSSFIIPVTSSFIFTSSSLVSSSALFPSSSMRPSLYSSATNSSTPTVTSLSATVSSSQSSMLTPLETSSLEVIPSSSSIIPVSSTSSLVPVSTSSLVPVSSTSSLVPVSSTSSLAPVSSISSLVPVFSSAVPTTIPPPNLPVVLSKRLDTFKPSPGVISLHPIPNYTFYDPEGGPIVLSLVGEVPYWLNLSATETECKLEMLPPIDSGGTAFYVALVGTDSAGHSAADVITILPELFSYPIHSLKITIKANLSSVLEQGISAQMSFLKIITSVTDTKIRLLGLANGSTVISVSFLRLERTRDCSSLLTIQGKIQYSNGSYTKEFIDAFDLEYPLLLSAAAEGVGTCLSGSTAPSAGPLPSLSGFVSPPLPLLSPLLAGLLSLCLLVACLALCCCYRHRRYSGLSAAEKKAFLKRRPVVMDSDRPVPPKARRATVLPGDLAHISDEERWLLGPTLEREPPPPPRPPVPRDPPPFK